MAGPGEGGGRAMTLWARVNDNDGWYELVMPASFALMAGYRAPYARAGQLVDIQFAILVCIQAVELGFHERHEFLFGSLAIVVLIHQQSLPGAGVRHLAFPRLVNNPSCHRRDTEQHSEH
jgi:hypothetical protein